MAVVLPSCPAHGVGPALMIANGPAGTRIRDRFASRPWLTPLRSLGVSFSAAWAGPVESVAEDHLDDQAVGGGREPDPHTGIELPLGPEVQVDHGEDLVLLLPEPVESGDRTKPGIVL